MRRQGESHLQNKVSNQISKQLAIILQKKVKDPRVGMVSINEVKVSGDLSIAKIYVTSIQDDNHKQVAQSLNSMSGFLRSELAGQIKIRNIPELRFYEDKVMESSKEIESILDKIKKE